MGSLCKSARHLPVLRMKIAKRAMIALSASDISRRLQRRDGSRGAVEVLEFQHNAVQDILKGYENATPGQEDMDLYNELVECAREHRPGRWADPGEPENVLLLAKLVG